MDPIIHAGEAPFQMVEPRVDAPLGHPQDRGDLEVGRGRRQDFLLAGEAGQALAVEPGPTFVDLTAFGVGLSPGLVLGHDPPVKRLAPLVDQDLTTATPSVGSGDQPVPAGLEPGQVDPRVAADGLELGVFNPGRGLEGQQDEAPPVGPRHSRQPREVPSLGASGLGHHLVAGPQAGVDDHQVFAPAPGSFGPEGRPLPPEGPEQKMAKGEALGPESPEEALDLAVELEEKLRHLVFALSAVPTQVVEGLQQDQIPDWSEGSEPFLIIDDRLCQCIIHLTPLAETKQGGCQG